jgi:hypothetical protein
MEKSFVVMIRIGFAGQATQAGGGPNDRFVELFPEGRGPHECLVVETGGQKRRKKIVDGKQVVFERTEMVLAGRFKPFEQFGHGGAGIGFLARTAPQLDECVGFFGSCREYPAWPVILERPCDKAPIIGDQSRCQRVARIPGHGLAVETE